MKSLFHPAKNSFENFIYFMQLYSCLFYIPSISNFYCQSLGLLQKAHTWSPFNVTQFLFPLALIYWTQTTMLLISLQIIMMET